MRHAALAHYGANIRKVKVYYAGLGNKVAYALNTLAQHVVRNAERLGKRYVVHRVKKPVVRDYYKRINVFLQVGYAVYGVVHPYLAFKTERLGDHAYRQYAQFLCACGNYRRGASAGAAAHARGYEHKVAVLNGFGYGFAAFFRRLAAHFGIRSRAQSLRGLFANLNLLPCAGMIERLLIGIYRNELHSLQAVLYHAVHGVVARAAHANHLKLRRLAAFKIQSKRHISCPPHYLNKSISFLNTFLPGLAPSSLPALSSSDACITKSITENALA